MAPTKLSFISAPRKIIYACLLLDFIGFNCCCCRIGISNAVRSYKKYFFKLNTHKQNVAFKTVMSNMTNFYELMQKNTVAEKDIQQ